MNIWSWNPGWDPFGELQRQMDRLFDLTATVGRHLYQNWRQFPAINLYEAETDYYLVAPIPGVRPEDLDVTIVENTLTIKGERRRTSAVPEEKYRRQERWHGKWSRTIQVPDNTDSNAVTASMENGVLVLRLPKVPESRPRQVPVQVPSRNHAVTVEGSRDNQGE